MTNLIEEIEEWQAEYMRHLRHPPKPGDVIRGAGGKPIRMEIHLEAGQDPFVFCRVYLPEIVGIDPLWVGRNIEDDHTDGWKFILMAKARRELIARYGMKASAVAVREIRVERLSESHGSLLGCVTKWCDNEQLGSSNESKASQSGEQRTIIPNPTGTDVPSSV